MLVLAGEILSYCLNKRFPVPLLEKWEKLYVVVFYRYFTNEDKALYKIILFWCLYISHIFSFNVWKNSSCITINTYLSGIMKPISKTNRFVIVYAHPVISTRSFIHLLYCVQVTGWCDVNVNSALFFRSTERWEGKKAKARWSVTGFIGILGTPDLMWVSLKHWQWMKVLSDVLIDLIRLITSLHGYWFGRIVKFSDG